MKLLLVFPNQLFVQPIEGYKLLFIESWFYFDRNLKFHKQKLILHRASMQAKYQALDTEKIYLSHPVSVNKLKSIIKQYDDIYAYDPVDDEVKNYYQQFNIKWFDSPIFLNTMDDLQTYFSDKKKYFMHDFYVAQRHKHNILIDNDKPVGGKYSFDHENRKKIPKTMNIPKNIIFENNDFVNSAKLWVDKHFPNNPGSLSFNYPTTRQEALQQLDYFLEYKFNYFGAYQDALSDTDPYLFHSNISSSLNIGLLSPQEVIKKALLCDVSLASKEGFIRQILGWREFIRAMYVLEGKTLKSANHLNHYNQLSENWTKANIGIPIINQTLKKIHHFAYSHHIERLMVLSNLMLLLNVHPRSVHDFFLTMHIDAYEWVMVPNVYGMSQFSAGNLMTTKPYFSGSNYLIKMGVKKGDWQNQWDAVFYLFLKQHRELIQKNPRLKMLINHLDKKDTQIMKTYETLKENLLSIAIKQ